MSSEPSTTSTSIHLAPSSIRFPGLPHVPSDTFTAGQAQATVTGPVAPLFSGVGGPALILVFAALGLLIGSLAAIFTLRALRPQMFAALDEQATRLQRGFDIPPSPKFRDKPKLSDLHFAPSQGTRRSSTFWRNLMPLSASIIRDLPLPKRVKRKTGSRDSVSSISSTASSQSRGSMSPTPPLSLSLDLRRHYPTSQPSSPTFHPEMSYAPTSPRTPTTPHTPTSPRTQMSPLVSAPGRNDLQITIPIAMPRAPPTAFSGWTKCPHDVDLEKGSQLACVDYAYELHHGEVPEFCLGVAEVRHHGKEDEWCRRSPILP